MELALNRPARFLPRNPRHGVDIETALVLGDDRVFPIRMENISSHGFMARCTIELAAGSWLGVELPGHGIVRARVRWWDDDEAGFQFRTPIDLHRYVPNRSRRLTGLFRAATPQPDGSLRGGAMRARGR